MELRHLQHFVALAQEGSFTRAARKVNIVQSGLSNSIKELEEELGSRLVERTTRKVTITESGMLFLPHAVPRLRRLRAPCTQFAPRTESFAGNCALASCKVSAFILSWPLS